MEIGKASKKHLKHMTSNQTARNINNKTSALRGIQEISKSFDATTDVIRQRKHSYGDCKEDEESILGFAQFVAIPLHSQQNTSRCVC
tara:strand:+ start:219 stop:479 length:261 start_codon:yes stop_codon:yes gene_type:complete